MFKSNRLGGLREAISCYDLWSYLAWQDIKIKYRRSKIGPLWITLSMAIFCVALGVVYSKLFKINISELLPFLAIGLITWNFIASTIGDMPNIFVDNASYIKDMRINLLNILLRVVVRNIIVFAHNLLIVVGIYLYFGFFPGFISLLALPGIFVVIINLIVIGIPISIVGARFRDLYQIIQSSLQVLFFITPIFWFPRLLSEGSIILTFNPIAYFLDIIRSPLLGQSPKLISWGVTLLILVLNSLFAAYIYRKKHSRVPFWI